jgi:hypothetical protein
MKWPVKSKWDRVGETRIKRRFLLFPKTIGDTTRWFEIASWKQRLTVHQGCLEDGDDLSWDNIEWVD